MSGLIGLSLKRNGLVNQFTSLGIDDNATSNAVTIDGSENVTITDGAHDFDVASHDATNGLKLGGTLVAASATELNTAADGSTSPGTTAVAGTDGFVTNDGGTMRQTTVATLDTYLSASTKTLTNKTWSGATIAVNKGGTGAATLTANYALLGNGTSAPQMIAPSTSGNVLTSNGSTWASTAVAASGGITYASQWHLTSTITPGASVHLLTNWAESSAGIGKLGTSMSHSSGEFSFPTGGEGFWLVTARPYVRLSSSHNAARMLNFYCRKTDDDWSSYKTPLWATQSMNVQLSDTTFSTYFGSAILDITSAGSGGDNKLQFYFSPSDSSYTGMLIGDTDNDSFKTVLTFIRIGDT